MSGFVFQWSEVLFLLVLVLPLAWLLAYARGRRADLIVALGGGLSTHRRLRDYLRLIAFILLVLALARPGYAPKKHTVSQTGRDVVFALDVSQSMLAEDVSPSRLEVSKQAVRDALKTFSNERVGLVVYAGSATIMCPLTYDYDFVRYMLEQVYTRSADFGGTMVQSAVEKVVDQVLMKDRGGVQDLVILTDGGDHGSQIPRVAELLSEFEVDLLLVGVGSPDESSPIPVVNQEGVRTLLRSAEGLVYTRLDDTSLRDLATQTAAAVYVSVGVQPFDLGQIYTEYVVGREVSASAGGEGIIIYQEAALFFLIPALVFLLLSEFWGSRGLQLGQIVMFAGALLCVPEMDAAENGPFEEASQLYRTAAFAEAEALFSEAIVSGSVETLSLGDLAAMQLNRGLCLMALSEAESEASAEMGLSYAQQAQLAFLAAKRYAPQLKRSGLRLESTATWLAQLQQRIEAEAESKEKLEAEMQNLVELLQAHLDAQTTLRDAVVDNDVDRQLSKREKNTPPPPPIVAPDNAGENAPIFSVAQGQLKVAAEMILVAMQGLDKQMVPPTVEGVPPMESLLAEPLKLMATVPPTQQVAVDFLMSWNTWPPARAAQQNAMSTIEAILAMLSSNSSDESDSDESEDMDYGEDYEYSDEMDEGMMSSMPMDGDFAAGGEMQALPLPNYSAEDILMEEQGSLQFRQQQRASANASKVEKDY
jgi:Ca-activated chloride channel homolog